MPRQRSRTPATTVHITVEERDMLLEHADPQTGIADVMRDARTTRALVCLELDERALQTFLDVLEGTANSAQQDVAMDRLAQAFARVDAGLAGNVDPGWHLLRPAVSRLDMSQREGQYLAFIHLYTRVHRRAPAESDIQEYFRTTPPAVHDMLKTLQRKLFIGRTAGVARSTRILLADHELPDLE